MKLASSGLIWPSMSFSCMAQRQTGRYCFDVGFDVSVCWSFWHLCRSASWRWKPVRAPTTGAVSLVVFGHEVRLISPAYVKPYVKRQKNDMADAEAIVEAAQRPTMRFVAVKSEDQQASAMIFKARDLLVRQRTRTINALRGHLAEFGIIAPKGRAHVGRLQVMVEDGSNSIPEPVRLLCQDLLDLIATLSKRIEAMDHDIKNRARQDDAAKRLMTIPGIGPVIAIALVTLAPPAQTFVRGRDLAAWMGLTPRQNSTGGKTRLGRTSKMGQRDLRAF